MRIAWMVFAVLFLGQPALAQQGGQQGKQEDDLARQTRDDVKTTLDDIGGAEDGAVKQPPSPPVNTEQIKETTQDLMKKNSDFIDSLR